MQISEYKRTVSSEPIRSIHLILKGVYDDLKKNKKLGNTFSMPITYHSAQNTTHRGLPPRFVYCIFLEVCVYVTGRKGSWIRLFLIVLINLWVFGIDDFEDVENTMDSPPRKYIHKIDTTFEDANGPS